MDSRPPPPREVLERKIDSMRPGAPTPPEPLAEEDITGVFDLALMQLAQAQQESQSALQTATERLLRETERTRELSRALSHPPQPPPKER